MANSFNNFTLKIAEEMLEGFESKRVLSKNVDTQKLNGRFDPDSGDTFDFKRPTDYVAVETSDGDVSALTESDIITGRASGVVQDYITVFIKFSEADEAIKMGNLRKLIAPAATRLVTTLELNFARFMMRNSALLAGTPGTPITSWTDIAAATSVMSATGVPAGDWMAAVNPYVQTALANETRSLGAGGAVGGDISDALRKAIISDDFGGMRVFTASTLASYTTDSEADRAGTVNAVDVTYNTAKNTMTQSIVVADFGANLEIRAGETLQVTGRNRLNLSTRQIILDGAGNAVQFSGTVTTAVTLSGTGTGTIVITGPAIFEDAAGTGAYNTTDTALQNGDVITLLGAASNTIQPGLFWHKEAFSIGSVPMEKLSATDTIAETEDGLQIRVTQFSDALRNQNKIRIDIRPAFAVLNPFFAGQIHG